jgi:nicotinamidase-related amidase
MRGRPALQLNAAPITISAGNTAGSISSTAARKEEPAKNGEIQKSGGTNGCESASGAAWLFLTNKMITSADTALILVDVQAKLVPAMHAQEALIENLRRLVQGVRILEVPILWTEQNPAGLGPTLPEIAGLLPDQKPMSKFSFSCCGSEQFRNELNALNRKNILIAGIESHVCVYQTAADLMNLQCEVQVISDAVASRTPENKLIGLEKSKSAGACLTSTETVLFELLKDANSEKFKEIIKIVK